MTSAVEVEELLRLLAPQVLGVLLRRHGDFDACEDAVQEALVAASTQWPTEGMPDNPKGWLITVASRRRIELWRSDSARRCREDALIVQRRAAERRATRVQQECGARWVDLDAAQTE